MKSQFKILYKDDSIAVCIKPVGVLSQDSETTENMPKLIKSELGCEYVGTVHRLDREVSGVMVYSLDEGITGRLSMIIQDKEHTDKKYLALVKGKPENDEGILFDLLYHDRSRNKTFVAKKERKGVKEASLFYKILSCGTESSLLLVKLFTGRTHQIRVQLASRAHSIIGDGKYGGGKGDIALYSVKLAFSHPKTNERLSFAFFPEDERLPAYHREEFDL